MALYHKIPSSRKLFNEVIDLTELFLSLGRRQASAIRRHNFEMAGKQLGPY